jgi:hypothetical protein
MNTKRADGSYDPINDAVYKEFINIVLANRRDRTMVDVVNGVATARRTGMRIVASASESSSLASAGMKVIDTDSFLANMAKGAKPVAAPPEVTMAATTDADIQADLDGSSPVSLSHADLVAYAKAKGVKANGKREAILARLEAL